MLNEKRIKFHYVLFTFTQAGILDRFNGFLVELELETTNMFSGSSTGSDPPQDFTSFPVLAATGNSFIQVLTRLLLHTCTLLIKHLQNCGTILYSTFSTECERAVMIFKYRHYI